MNSEGTRTSVTLWPCVHPRRAISGRAGAIRSRDRSRVNSQLHRIKNGSWICAQSSYPWNTSYRCEKRVFLRTYMAGKKKKERCRGNDPLGETFPWRRCARRIYTTTRCREAAIWTTVGLRGFYEWWRAPLCARALSYYAPHLAWRVILARRDSRFRFTLRIK